MNSFPLSIDHAKIKTEKMKSGRNIKHLITNNQDVGDLFSCVKMLPRADMIKVAISISMHIVKRLKNKFSRKFLWCVCTLFGLQWLETVWNMMIRPPVNFDSILPNGLDRRQ